MLDPDDRRHPLPWSQTTDGDIVDADGQFVEWDRLSNRRLGELVRAVNSTAQIDAMRSALDACEQYALTLASVLHERYGEDEESPEAKAAFEKYALLRAALKEAGGRE